MKPNYQSSIPKYSLLIIAGIALFIGLSIYAASLYPGGSQFDANSIGYDWMKNYWCNLLNEEAGNGQSNPGSIYAIIAHLILCGSILIFFLQFSSNTKNNKRSLLIKYGGLLSMISAAFIYSEYHDILTIISSVFGLFAVIAILLEIKNGLFGIYKWFGLICIILLTINNLIYYTGIHLGYLPLIQKVSFLIVLSWIIGTSLFISRSSINQR